MESEAATLGRITDVFREVLGRDALSLTRATTSNDVEGWDSLAHVSLMLAVQQAFAVRLSASESSRLANVGALVDLIQSKRAAAGRTE